MSDERELVVFRAEGPVVRFDPAAQMWSMSEMHRASGGDLGKAPAQWLGNAQTADYLVALLAKCEREAQFPGVENCAGEAQFSTPARPEGGRAGRAGLAAWSLEIKEIATRAGLILTREGRSGGTWAHWQIAAAYAHYLDPAFYLQWNEWAMAHRTGQAPAAPAQLAALDARLAALEARQSPAPFADGRRMRRRDGAGQVLVRRVTERITEEITLADVPDRPLTEAIRATLRQAGRPLRPIEITALLQAVGAPVTHPVQVSSALWHMRRAGAVARDGAGRYQLADADDLPFEP